MEAVENTQSFLKFYCASSADLFNFKSVIISNNKITYENLKKIQSMLDLIKKFRKGNKLYKEDIAIFFKHNLIKKEHDKSARNDMQAVPFLCEYKR